MIRRAVMLAFAAVVLIGADANDPTGRLAWMGGCWEWRTPTLVVEEMWQAPRGGMMLGVSRTTAGDSVVAYEAIRIEARGDALAAIATPSGQPTAEFTSIEIGDSLVVFENLAHDFPQRVIYRHAPGDSMHARIEGILDGAERSADFRYGRVSCPG